MGVTTHPTATYPWGGLGRHTAIVPSGFLRDLEPLSCHTRVNPSAAAVGGGWEGAEGYEEDADVDEDEPPPPPTPPTPPTTTLAVLLLLVQGARATRASEGALKQGTTTVPRDAVPGGQTGAHADISTQGPIAYSRNTGPIAYSHNTYIRSRLKA